MTRHSQISYAKSIVRIVGFCALMLPNLHLALISGAGFLIIAEILGILEEIGATY